MTREEFINAMKIMHTIDRVDLERANIIGHHDFDGWREFRDNPWLWMIEATALQQKIVWLMIEQRQK